MQIVDGFDFEDFSDRLGHTIDLVSALELAVKGALADEDEQKALRALSIQIESAISNLRREIDAEAAREIKRAA